MKVRLIVDMEMPPSTDWPNTRLAELQQTGEVNNLADYLALAEDRGEYITHVRAQIIEEGIPVIVHALVGGTYVPKGVPS